MDQNQLPRTSRYELPSPRGLSTSFSSLHPQLRRCLSPRKPIKLILLPLILASLSEPEGALRVRVVGVPAGEDVREEAGKTGADGGEDWHERRSKAPYTMLGLQRASSREIKPARSFRLEKGTKGGASGASM